MARFDRYMLSQLLVLFGFFSLVLVAVFWINHAVVLFDRLIGDGQTALVFLEFSALGLPELITTVLPLATFAAAVYVTNRLSNESELTVMQATGSGPWRLARPVLIYGLIAALMMSVLAHYLVPTARAQLSNRESDISQNVTARLLTEGTFLHPTNGITFYTREIAEDGVLRDVFLSDRRDPDERVIYTAAKSYLVRNGDVTTLIMVDGLAQRLATNGLRLSTTKFQDFSFNMTSLVDKGQNQVTSLTHTPTFGLLFDWDAVSKAKNTTTGAVAEELHSRFAQSLFCIIAALIGFSTLQLGAFSRFGVWREVMFAFVLLIFVDGMENFLVEPVLEDSSKWSLLYIPTLIGALINLSILGHATNPFWWRRRVTA